MQKRINSNCALMATFVMLLHCLLVTCVKNWFNCNLIVRMIIILCKLQLYKTREDKYLLDLQRVQGSQFLFLDLCAALLNQLRVL